jgi:hypothetical protein
VENRTVLPIEDASGMHVMRRVEEHG